MSRPATNYPTPAELEVLKSIWEHGPRSSRQVLEDLNGDGKDRAYTSVASLMNVMVDKGMLKRIQQGRAFVYSATRPQKRTLSELLRDLLGRAFEGSAKQLVVHLLESEKLTEEELEQIREAIDERINK